MPCCVIKGCKNYDTKVKKQHGISYHRFPHQPARYEIWCRLIRLQRRQPNYKPQKNTRICSAHFSDDDIEYSKSGLRKLKPTAVPKVEIPNWDPSQSQQLHKQVHSQFDARVPEVSGQADAGRGQPHVGYRCGLCRKQIFGFRYACVECASLDLCSVCEGRAYHSQHYVLRIPAHKQQVEVEAVIENIRNVLLKRDNSVEPEVKLEQSELWLEPDPLNETSFDGDNDDKDSSDDSQQDNGTIEVASTPTAEESERMDHSAFEVPIPVTIKTELGDEGVRGASATHLPVQAASKKAVSKKAAGRKRVATSTVSDGPSCKASRVGAGGASAEQGEAGFVVFTHQHTLPHTTPKGPLPLHSRWSRSEQLQTISSNLNQSAAQARTRTQQAVPSTDTQPSSNQELYILDGS